jgi:hypothetical protein
MLTAVVMSFKLPATEEVCDIMGKIPRLLMHYLSTLMVPQTNQRN